MDRKVTEYFNNGSRRVINVLPTKDYVLILEFDNGEKRIFDMKDELTGVFTVLKDMEKFNTAFIANGNVA